MQGFLGQRKKIKGKMCYPVKETKMGTITEKKTTRVKKESKIGLMEPRNCY